ncbi:MAG: hypothetical protein HY901_26405 [Deltaproteobacteria bacterium]|nr:hypothetical protein [Deltaproteobacteria bacterium]
MKLAFLLVVSSVIAFAGCSGTGDGDFKDELRFGTGMNAASMTLTGQAESFDLATTSMLTFRMESSAAFDGRFVRLYFNRLEQKDFSACASKDAHICLSQFAVSSPGTYEVKAYLVKTILDIGEETLVASRSFTLR